MNADPEAPGFAPDDPTDNRSLGEWESRYAESHAKKAIVFEASYLGVLLFILPAVIFLIMSGMPRDWLGLNDTDYALVERCALTC